MNYRKITAAALGGLIASLSPIPSANATGDVWVEGSYESLNLPNVQFVNHNHFTGVNTGFSRYEFVNDDGDFADFRLDGGIDNISIMGGAYVMGVKGFFAAHDDASKLICGLWSVGPTTGDTCGIIPLIDNPSLFEGIPSLLGSQVFILTERDVDHWGVALDIAHGPSVLKTGPAFRRIDQNIKITSREINAGDFAGEKVADPYQFTYSEDLETNYWGAFVGADGSIDLDGGWSLQGDAEAGLYWADTDYSGNYSLTNGVGLPINGFFNPNVVQSLSLDSNELAFIGVLKAALERNFGKYNLAGFGRVEYISSAPDVAYNDRDGGTGFGGLHGKDNGTRVGERFAYTASVGARVTVPMSLWQPQPLLK